METGKLLISDSPGDVLVPYMVDENYYRGNNLTEWSNKAAYDLGVQTVPGKKAIRRYFEWNTGEEDPPTTYAKILAFGGILTPLSREFMDNFWVIKKTVEAGNIDYAVDQLKSWDPIDGSTHWEPGLTALARAGQWEVLADWLPAAIAASDPAVVERFEEAGSEFFALLLANAPRKLREKILSNFHPDTVIALLPIVTAIAGKPPRDETPAEKTERIAEEERGAFSNPLKYAIQYNHPKVIETIDLDTYAEQYFVSSLFTGSILSKRPLKDPELWEQLRASGGLVSEQLANVYQALAYSGLPLTPEVERLNKILQPDYDDLVEHINLSLVPSSSFLFDILLKKTDKIPEDFVELHAGDPLAVLGAVALRPEFDWKSMKTFDRARLVNDIITFRQDFMNTGDPGPSMIDLYHAIKKN